MHPILLTLGDFPVYTYGVLMALAILLGALWLKKRAQPLGVTEDKVYAAVMWMVVIGLLGARLLYVVYFPQTFFENPVQALTERGGLVWYGGLIGAILAGIAYVRLNKIPLWPFADAAIVPAALGLAIGRIGCFMSGCCFGSECHLPWAVQFPPGHETYPMWLHPTQLYESFGVLVLIGLLLCLQRLPFYRPSMVFFAFLGGYGVLRFAIECLRADALSVGVLSSSQWFSVVGLTVSVVGLFLASRQPQSSSHA